MKTTYTHSKAIWAFTGLPFIAIGFLSSLIASSLFVGWSMGHSLCDRVWDTSMKPEHMAFLKALEAAQRNQSP